MQQLYMPYIEGQKNGLDSEWQLVSQIPEMEN